MYGTQETTKKEHAIYLVRAMRDRSCPTAPRGRKTPRTAHASKSRRRRRGRNWDKNILIVDKNNLQIKGEKG